MLILEIQKLKFSDKSTPTAQNEPGDIRILGIRSENISDGTYDGTITRNFSL